MQATVFIYVGLLYSFNPFLYYLLQLQSLERAVLKFLVFLAVGVSMG